MNGRRTQPSFLREVGFGLVLSIAAAVVGTALVVVLPIGTIVRVVVAGVGLAYLLRTLAGSSEKTGRVLTVALWVAAAAAAWLMHASLGVYVLVHVIAVWLARSLYRYSSLVEAGLDLGLTVLAVCFGVFAALRTESLALAIWCFFLLQAMHVAIPGLARRLLATAEAESACNDPNRAFATALNAADEALQRLAVRR